MADINLAQKCKINYDARIFASVDNTNCAIRKKYNCPYFSIKYIRTKDKAIIITRSFGQNLRPKPQIAV